jgi:hypothetical protein
MTRVGRLLFGRVATWMDEVPDRYFAQTAVLSTTLRFGQDDKPRDLQCASPKRKTPCLLLLLIFFFSAFEIRQVGEAERVPGGRVVGSGQEQQTGDESPQHQAH